MLTNSFAFSEGHKENKTSEPVVFLLSAEGGGGVSGGTARKVFQEEIRIMHGLEASNSSATTLLNKRVLINLINYAIKCLLYGR